VAARRNGGDIRPCRRKDLREGAVSAQQAEIEAITAAGYQNVENVDFKDGRWKAEAENGSGKAVKLMVDPDDGSVIGEALD
jgi:hypothetical protein